MTPNTSEEILRQIESARTQGRIELIEEIIGGKIIFPEGITVEYCSYHMQRPCWWIKKNGRFDLNSTEKRSAFGTEHLEEAIKLARLISAKLQRSK